MIFDYILTLDDITAFWMYSNTHLRHRRQGRWIAGGFFVLCGLLMLGVAWWFFMRASAYYATQPSDGPTGRMFWDWGRIGCFLILGFACLKGSVAAWVVSPASLHRQVKRQAHTTAIRQMLGPQHLSITATYYRIKTTTSERQQNWGALEAFHSTDTACYLFTSLNEAVIVPRRGIEDGEGSMEWSTFCDLLRTYTTTSNSIFQQAE